MTMSPSHKYNTRSSAKRKRLDNQEDEPRVPKAQKLVAKPIYKPSPTPERAKRAERRKLARLMKARGPVDEIDETELASRGTRPEVRLYGWPFKSEHMLAYAQRHHLRFIPSKAGRKLFGGKEEVDFADLTEEHYHNALLMMNLRNSATFRTVLRLSELAGTPLRVARPYSLDWDGLVYIYSNYNAEKRCDVIDGLGLFDRIVKVMDEAMNEEVKGERSKLQWWYTYTDSEIFTNP